MLSALAAAMAIAGIVAFVGLAQWTRAEEARRLPAIPDLTGQPAAVAAHIAAADADARADPSSADAVGALGMAYHADLLYDAAVSAYARASQLDPASWRWPYFRALVHAERGEAAEASEALRAVVAAHPGLAIAWWRLGESAFKRVRYDEADAAYARAESATGETDDGGVRAYASVGRARVALLRGDTATAERILLGVIDANARFGPAHRVLSEVLRSQGRAEDAERHAARAAALKAYQAPNDVLVDALGDVSRSPVFLLRQAAATDIARESARRERLVKRALESDPDNPDVVYEVASLMQQLGRPADALPFFQRHLQMMTDDQQTLVQIGKSYSDLNRLEEAEATLRRALAVGDDPVGFYNLGFVLERRGRFDEAEASYRRAVALGPGLARARNNLGGLLARSGRLAEAAEQLLESIRLDPSAPDAYTNFSAVLLQRGSLADAARYARLAIDVEPRHADAHANLAVALAGLGDLEQARQHLAEALRLDPHHDQARRNLAALKQ
jgi:tetratricopeptide (TPR) repeat protein